MAPLFTTRHYIEVLAANATLALEQRDAARLTIGKLRAALADLLAALDDSTVMVEGKLRGRAWVTAESNARTLLDTTDAGAALLERMKQLEAALTILSEPANWVDPNDEVIGVSAMHIAQQALKEQHNES